MTRIELIKNLVYKAGATILEFSKDLQIYEKEEGQLNFATEADLKSEQIIVEGIKKYFTTDSILSEESFSSINNPLDKPNLWIIDPIDGTNNFKARRGYSSISIGYTEKGDLKLGAIYNPYSDELFFAEKGKGAYCNQKLIKVGTRTDLTKTEIGTDSYYTAEGTRRNLELGLKIVPTPMIWSRGSAVTQMTEVACGRLDLFYHTKVKPWDNAAAFLINKEAGGKIAGLDGQEISFLSEEVIVGNETLVNQFLKYINS